MSRPKPPEAARLMLPCGLPAPVASVHALERAIVPADPLGQSGRQPAGFIALAVIRTGPPTTGHATLPPGAREARTRAPARAGARWRSCNRPASGDDPRAMRHDNDQPEPDRPGGREA